MNYVSVNNQSVVRRIGFSKESSPDSLTRCIQDAFELPSKVKFFCVHADGTHIDVRDLLGGNIKSFQIQYEEIEELNLFTLPEQTLFDILNPMLTLQTDPHAGYMPLHNKFEDEEMSPSRSNATPKHISQCVPVSRSQEEDSALPVVQAQTDFQGSRYQNQIIKFERILAHLVNERTVLAWFRTNLAFVTLGMKYLKLGNVYLSTERVASVVLFICGGLFMVILPFSWYSGYSRYAKCKEMIDYNAEQIGVYLHKMGFDFDNVSLAIVIFASFFGIIFSSTVIIWTTATSDDYLPI
jgi:uncharacterized membrane protein YidH (DUF202 family)